jgi:hypothetical protein
MSEPWEPRNAWLMRYAAYEEMHKTTNPRQRLETGCDRSNPRVLESVLKRRLNSQNWCESPLFTPTLGYI